VPLQLKPAFRQSLRPSVARADAARLVEQAVLLLLGGEASELRIQRMIGRQERLLAMENGRVGAGRVLSTLGLATD